MILRYKKEKNGNECRSPCAFIGSRAEIPAFAIILGHTVVTCHLYKGTKKAVWALIAFASNPVLVVKFIIDRTHRKGIKVLSNDSVWPCIWIKI